MSYILIAKARVDSISYHLVPEIGCKLYLHFNCWNQDGEALIGLGGMLNEEILAVLLPDRAQVTGLEQLLVDTAQRWILDYDDYISELVTLKKIELQRYKPIGIGMNIEFHRKGDLIASSLLLAYIPDRGISHNYKRQITDARIMHIVGSDLETILAAADELALAANQQRKIEINRRIDAEDAMRQGRARTDGPIL